jgi:hypothetical protein
VVVNNKNQKRFGSKHYTLIFAPRFTKRSKFFNKTKAITNRKIFGANGNKLIFAPAFEKGN